MPHPVDKHVGEKLKQMRNLKRISQTELARELNTSFQQIQKYEVGSNRIAASRLYDLATILGVPTDYFFAGLEQPSRTSTKTSDNSAKEISETSSSQIRTGIREVYPDLQDRLAYMVQLVLEEQSKFAILPIPNEPDALSEYRREEEFLHTLKVGLISVHQDLPPLSNEIVSEAEAKQIQDQLVKLAKLANTAVTYLDGDKGTYGGLYKIGLISAVAALLSTIPGVNFVTGAALPTLIFGAQTVRLKVSKDD